MTRRAGGGEIVRTRPIAASAPMIGRGADCDIHIADLAVGLHHARLAAGGPGAVHIESIGSLPFEIDRRFVRAADVELADAPSLTLGNHLLTLTAGEAPDEVIVTVERKANARGAPSPEDERAVFAPVPKVLDKRRLAWSLALVILLACLAAPIAVFHIGHGRATIHPDRQWSSGPLSKVHGFLGNRCEACHQQAFVAVRDGACLACHGAGGGRAAMLRMAAEVRAEGSSFAPRLIFDHAAHARLRAATPLPLAIGPRIAAIFERVFNHSSDRCASCHLEHLAIDHRPPLVQSVDRRPRGAPLLAVVNRCSDCHAQLRERLPSTALLDVPDWGRHPDFRPLLTVSASGPILRRAPLARRPLENPGLFFDHRLHLAPGGGVARMAQVLGPARGYGAPLTCAACHRPDGVGRSFTPVEMVRDCSACHSLAFARRGGVLRNLPHGSVSRVVATLETFYPVPSAGFPAGGRRIPGLAEEILQWWRRASGVGAPSSQAARAIRVTFAQGGVCSYCHTIGRPRDPASMAYAIAPVHLSVRYLPLGGFDHGVPAHHLDSQNRPSCGVCHGARQSDRAADVLLPRIEQCAACHGRTKAQTVSAASSDCAECHSYHAPGEPTSRVSVRQWGPPTRTAPVVPDAERSVGISWTTAPSMPG
jgi:hypothetical protein